MRQRVPLGAHRFGDEQRRPGDAAGLAAIAAGERAACASSCPRCGHDGRRNDSPPRGSGRPSVRTTIETTNRHSAGSRCGSAASARRGGSKSLARSSSDARRVVGGDEADARSARRRRRRRRPSRARACGRCAPRARRAATSPPWARSRSTRKSTSSSSPPASRVTPRVHAPCRRATAKSGRSTAWLAKRAGTSTMAR